MHFDVLFHSCQMLLHCALCLKLKHHTFSHIKGHLWDSGTLGQHYEEERKIRRKVVDSSPHGRDDAWSLLVSGWYSAHFILEKELEINSAWCDEFNFSNEIINASSYNPNRTLQLMSESGASSVPMNLHDMQDIFRIRRFSALGN